MRDTVSADRSEANPSQGLGLRTIWLIVSSTLLSQRPVVTARFVVCSSTASPRLHGGVYFPLRTRSPADRATPAKRYDRQPLVPPAILHARPFADAEVMLVVTYTVNFSTRSSAHPNSASNGFAKPPRETRSSSGSEVAVRSTRAGSIPSRPL